MEKKYINGKFASFIKKNIYYLLMIACIIAIGTMITIAAINGANNRDPNVIVNTPDPTDPTLTDPDPTDPVVTDPTDTPIVFAMPVANAEIGMDYSMDVLLYHSTLNQWMVHKGIDFKAPEGTPVVAAWDGMVKSITTDALNGTTIVIQHDNDMQTLYSSLDNDVSVVLNQVVKKGDAIGKVSTSMLKYSEGPLMHFEVLVGGENVDPNEFLPIENK